MVKLKTNKTDYNRQVYIGFSYRYIYCYIIETLIKMSME